MGIVREMHQVLYSILGLSNVYTQHMSCICSAYTVYTQCITVLYEIPSSHQNAYTKHIRSAYTLHMQSPRNMQCICNVCSVMKTFQLINVD